MNEQQHDFLTRRRKQLAKRLRDSAGMKYTAALRKVKQETDLCKNCGAFIQKDEAVDWYHGDINAGWNTTCNDGDADTIAEPMLED